MDHHNFYNKDGIIVRRSIKSDVEFLKDKLREDDIKEIWASHNVLPEQGLKHCLDKSIFCLTVENGNPLMMFGIIPETILGYKAGIWMLSSDEIDSIKIRFVRNQHKFIDMFLDYYKYLYNYVHVNNKKSIRWLKALGAKIEKPRPYGIEGELFYYFYFDKGVK